MTWCTWGRLITELAPAARRRQRPGAALRCARSRAISSCAAGCSEGGPAAFADGMQELRVLRLGEEDMQCRLLR